jgi:RimJ/RimL family protein N-acetyltransferase
MNPSGEASIKLVAFDRGHLAATFGWFNDRELARMLGRLNAVTPEAHERWFAGLAERQDTLHFAIEVHGVHAGNVWLANIDRDHRKAEVRIAIGKPSQAGSGAGTEALQLISRYAFDTLGLHRVYAFVLAFNPRARRAFEKAGFVLEGTLRHDRWDGHAFVDTFLLGRVDQPAASTAP